MLFGGPKVVTPQVGTVAIIWPPNYTLFGYQRETSSQVVLPHLLEYELSIFYLKFMLNWATGHKGQVVALQHQMCNKIFKINPFLHTTPTGQHLGQAR